MAKFLLTTEHNDCIIAYTHGHDMTPQTIDYLKDIYALFSPMELPMYAFFDKMALIFTHSPSGENDLKLARDFEWSNRPTDFVNYSTFRFNPNDPEFTIDAVTSQILGEKRKKRIESHLDLYYNDLYRMILAFEIVHV